ncbi:MAG: hypothetical protein V2A53_00940 [bacterium]
MKKLGLIFTLFIFTILFSRPVMSANKSDTFKCRTKIIRDEVVCYEKRPYTYNFQVEVVSDDTGTKHEIYKDDYPFITANFKERYSVIIHNPLPVQAAVNLTIDGLNSITGKPCSPSEGSKWIIDPYSYITVRGWQVSGADARRFYFTSKKASYASWRSNSWGKDLSVNCGVIGAAYFWNKKDLERYFEQNPVYEYTRKSYNNLREMKKEAPCEEVPCVKDKALAEQEAGTGMGERESNPVESIRFEYNTGMYKARDAVIIFYDFAKIQPKPQPFLERDFAPEQP